MGKLVKEILLFLCLLTFCDLTLLAQTGVLPGVLHIKEKSAIHVLPQQAPAGLEKIYSNLNTPTDLYEDSEGRTLSGPHSVLGLTFFGAIPFTPKSNSHVSQVRAAVQYAGYGGNQANFSIYGDSGGIPGTLLAGPVTVPNLPDEGTCCLLAVASFSPVSVSAGTRYWVVVDTPLTGTGSDFLGTWNSVEKPIIPAAWTLRTPTDWESINADLLPAGEVLGTVP